MIQDGCGLFLDARSLTGELNAFLPSPSRLMTFCSWERQNVLIYIFHSGQFEDSSLF